MEEYEDFYKTICRVCLSNRNDKNMVPLLDSASKDGISCYGKAVMIFANIVVKQDSLPSFMCQICLAQLKQAIIFKKNCEYSQKRLKHLTRRSKCSNTGFEEIVSQYVMFIQYFSDTSISKVTKSKKNSNMTHSNCNNREKSIDKVKKEEKVDTESDVFIDNADFHDNYQNDTSENEENNGNTNNVDREQDIDNLLDTIENIIKMDPKQLNCYHKKYAKNLTKSKFNNKKHITSPYNRRERLRIAQKRNIQCKICNKVLANLATYKCHMQMHNGCRYVCELCAKGFAVYAQLQAHQAAVHGFGRFFICKQCGFKASRKWDLVEHERFHTGERPYACDKCGLTFRRRFIWKKHALYHMEKTVQCPKCPRKFYQRGDMLAHSNNVHERVYVYACHECDVTYAKPATVRRHLVEKHGIPRERQGKVIRILLSSVRE